jgi:hypothetical protein
MELLEEIFSPLLSRNYFTIRHTTQFELNEKEIQSENENFIQEKNMKYSLYPLYINWKKIESKKLDNIMYYNIFKIYGYFGAAIFNLLCESDEGYHSYKNFLFELNLFYVRFYSESQIKNEFLKKITSIYDDVISLIKNKIIIFKEISVFLIIMRLYELNYKKIKDNDKLFEVIKYHYVIISYLNEHEYNKIYLNYFRKINRRTCDDFLLFGKLYLLPKTKKEYLNYLKTSFKNLPKELFTEKKEVNHD